MGTSRRTKQGRLIAPQESELVWQDEWVKIYCGDARQMREVKDESVHLLVTSPPYWDIKNYRDGSQIGLGQSYGEYLLELGNVGREMYRVLAPGRFLCWVIGTRISDGDLKHIPADCITIFSSLRFVLKKEIIWMKPRGTQGLWQRGTTQFLRDKPYPGCLNINIQHEFILIFQKQGELTPNPEHRLPEDFIKDVAWSVWELGVSMTKGHPAPFPLQLPDRLIQLYSYPGETVLDPFLGTGTTVRAAKALRRRGVGYEISQKFCDLAVEQIRRQELPLPDMH